MKKSFFYLVMSVLCSGLFAQSETEPNNSVNEAGVITITQNGTLSGQLCLAGNGCTSDAADFWNIQDGADGTFSVNFSGISAILHYYTTPDRSGRSFESNLSSGNSILLYAAGYYSLELRVLSAGTFPYSAEINGTALPSPNAKPTAQDFTIQEDVFQGIQHIFQQADFNYADGDNDPIDHLRIVSAPSEGNLYVDANDDDSYTSGEEITAGAIISAADLSAGNLQYLAQTGQDDSFTFDVNDGSDYSENTYTVTLPVIPIPTASLSLSSSSLVEDDISSVSVIVTLSNAYGRDITIPLVLSGTAEVDVDYEMSGVSIFIPSGKTMGELSISPAADQEAEEDETVILTFGNAANVIFGSPSEVTFTIIDDDPTAVFSKSKADVLSIHPNPSSGSFTINSTVNGSYSISLLNQQGENVRSWDASTQNVSLDPKLEPGMYFVMVRQEDTVKSARLIIE